MESGQGQTFGVFLTGAMILVLLFSVVKILGKRPGGTPDKTEGAVTGFRGAAVENRARDEPSPEPKKRE